MSGADASDGTRRAPWLSEGSLPREGEATPLPKPGTAPHAPTKRRLVPTLLTPQTLPSKSSVAGGSSEAPAHAGEEAVREDGIEDAMRDDMDDENLDSDESHAPEALGDDERQALVDELVTAELELQKLACILDGGGHADRRLGDDAHDVHPARLAAERELLASLREQEGCEEEARAEAALSEDSPQEAEGASLLEGASQPEVASPQPEVPGTEESASTCFAEAMAESKCAYESALQDAYDEHLERIANLQEELEASGVSVVSLQALMRAREAELLPTHSAEEIETPSLEAQPLEAQSADGTVRRRPAATEVDRKAPGEASSAQRVCVKCARPGARPWTPRPTEMSQLSSPVLDEKSDELPPPPLPPRLLCYVCSAEEELESERPLSSKHGRVCERGATGFTGWTEGMQRTSDAGALKAMYRFSSNTHFPQRTHPAPRSCHMSAKCIVCVCV